MNPPDGWDHQMLVARICICRGCDRGFMVGQGDAAMVTACPFCRAPMDLTNTLERVQ